MMRAMECWYVCGEPIIFRTLQDVLGQCRSGLLQSSIFVKQMLFHSMEYVSSPEADLHARFGCSECRVLLDEQRCRLAVPCLVN